MDAVIRNFEGIGEAANHVPIEIQERHPEIDWSEMRAIRNVMIHEYFGVSLRIIWRTVINDLEPLAEALGRVLSEEDQMLQTRS